MQPVKSTLHTPQYTVPFAEGFIRTPIVIMRPVGAVHRIIERHKHAPYFGSLLEADGYGLGIPCVFVPDRHGSRTDIVHVVRSRDELKLAVGNSPGLHICEPLTGFVIQFYRKVGIVPYINFYAAAFLRDLDILRCLKKGFCQLPNSNGILCCAVILSN